jgi:EAL domain-containing protein (putative c-di-GMP-specific phosphodiesterase class I)/CheY-like chemotaxis protein
MDEKETRWVMPLVCVTDGKPHIRKFLREALSEFGFTIYECVQVSELSAALDAKPPDLVVLGLTAGGVAASEMLKTLAAKDFDGKVLPFAPRDSAVAGAIQQLAEKLGIAMLPPLLMPLSNERLRNSIAILLPEASSGPLVDMGEAVRGGWLELWYQPKIDARAIVMRGALLRVRHPVWGIVPPAYFIADDGDPRSRLVSETVISCAVDDWHHFFSERGPIELAINLPIAFLQDPDSISSLCQKLPHHTAFEGLIIESNGTDIVRNLKRAKDVARQLRFHKIAISIDDLGAEWLSLTGLRDFPFVEVKVDRKFITGCANDRLKQSMCRRIVDLANGYGARTVAEGVETWADFLAVREMGFDLVQGFLFAKPMSAEKFAHTCWAASQVCLPRRDPSLWASCAPTQV